MMMTYMQSNLAFAGGIQELSFDEIEFVSGGWVYAPPGSPLLDRGVDGFCARLPGRFGIICRGIADGLEWLGVAFTFQDIVAALPDGEMTAAEKKFLIELAKREQARRPGAGG
jgi:hypothetical protein